jgi:tRNA (cytidine/uridine-2'-O-)-methyltransferase
MIRIALYQPDIPQNTGAMMRLCACLGVGLDIIEPCGFPWDERKIRRSGMDYIDHVDLVRHGSWERFLETYRSRRFVLLTTKTDTPYTRFTFTENDILIAGRESAGVPDDVHNAVTARVTIPMAGATRSLNVVNATAMIVGEALRQLSL